MELWDVYNRNREKTGKTMVRGAEFEEGAYHTVVHICIFSSDGRMLIQQRQTFKHGWPGLWDLTVGGSAVAGEDAQTAASRELSEELGIEYDFSDVRPSLTMNFEHGFDDYFLIGKDIELSDLKFQPEEVQNAKWATKQDILQMIEDGSFIPYHTPLIELLFELRGQYGAFRG